MTDNEGTIEWGIRLEWPDGHVEYSLASSRNSAQTSVRSKNHGTDNKGEAATLVARTIGPWVEYR